MGKDDTLVGKLFELLKSAKPEDIEKSLAEAERLMEESARLEKKGFYCSLFDTQLQTLEDRGCPIAILEVFQEQKNVVIAKALEMVFPEGNIPFLPVIPKSYMSSFSQMPMVKNGSQVGFTYLDPNQITDVVDTPNAPYFIFNVEDGQAMLGKSPQDAKKLIEKQNRRGLTDTEVIALGIHTDVLQNHSVFAIGSRSGSGFAPNLCLHGDGPKLGYSSLGDAGSRWGAGSCSR